MVKSCVSVFVVRLASRGGPLLGSSQGGCQHVCSMGIWGCRHACWRWSDTWYCTAGVDTVAAVLKGGWKEATSGFGESNFQQHFVSCVVYAAHVLLSTKGFEGQGCGSVFCSLLRCGAACMLSGQPMFAGHPLKGPAAAGTWAGPAAEPRQLACLSVLCAGVHLCLYGGQCMFPQHLCMHASCFRVWLCRLQGRIACWLAWCACMHTCHHGSMATALLCLELPPRLSSSHTWRCPPHLVFLLCRLCLLCSAGCACCSVVICWRFCPVC